MGLISRIIRCFCSEAVDDEQYVPNGRNHNLWVASRDTPANGVSLLSSTSSKECANTISPALSSGVIDAHYQQYLSNLQESRKYNSSTSDALKKNRASSQSSFQESGKYCSGTSNALQQSRASSQSSSEEPGKNYSGTSNAFQQDASSQLSFLESGKCYSGTSNALQQDASTQSSLQESGKYYSAKSNTLQQNGATSKSSSQESGNYYSSTFDALQKNRANSQSSFKESRKYCSGTADSFSQPSLQESVTNLVEILPDVVKKVVVEEKWIKWYSSCQRILVVGDGDFSFSASLAKAFGSAPNMIATSLDSREFLRLNYNRAISNIQELERRGCRVIHEMDCTKMAKKEPLEEMTFDRIVYNFPFAGFFKNMPRESQLRLHRKLVSQFMENAKKLISKKGEIHITHKSNCFHRDWNLEQLALVQGLKLMEAVHFNHNEYPGYRTKTGFGGDNNFNCNPSKTYKFCLSNC